MSFRSFGSCRYTDLIIMYRNVKNSSGAKAEQQSKIAEVRSFPTFK